VRLAELAAGLFGAPAVVVREELLPELEVARFGLPLELAAELRRGPDCFGLVAARLAGCAELLDARASELLGARRLVVEARRGAASFSGEARSVRSTSPSSDTGRSGITRPSSAARPASAERWSLSSAP
jgi:hypothetical protein